MIKKKKKKKGNRNFVISSRTSDRFESNCWLQDNLVKVIKNGPVSEIELNRHVEIVDGSIRSFMVPSVFSFCLSLSCFFLFLLPLFFFVTIRERIPLFAAFYYIETTLEETHVHANETNETSNGVREKNIRATGIEI